MRCLLLLLAWATGCDGDAACASRYGLYELAGSRVLASDCDDATEGEMLDELATVPTMVRICVSPSQACGDGYALGAETTFGLMVVYGVNDRGIVDAVLTGGAGGCTASFALEYAYVTPLCDPMMP